MDLNKQIEIVKELLEGIEELNGGYQGGWDQTLVDGEQLLEFLLSNSKNLKISKNQ